MILTSLISDQRPYVYIRDSKDPDGIFLGYPFDAWDGGRVVRFTCVPSSSVPGGLRTVGKHGGVWYRTGGNGRCLYLTSDELLDFKKGIEEGRFDPVALI